MSELISEPTTLAISWDLGPRLRPQTLFEVQRAVNDFVDSATLLEALREGRRSPEDFLRHRGDRVYLRGWPSTPTDLDDRPDIVAIGYSNPWWEVLQDPASVLGWGLVGSTLASRALALVTKGVEVIKTVALARTDIRASRAQLNRLIEADEDLGSVVRDSKKVSTSSSSRAVRRAADSDQREDAIEALTSEPDVRAVPSSAVEFVDDLAVGSRRPSVTGGGDPQEAALALAGFRLVEAIDTLLDLAIQLDRPGIDANLLSPEDVERTVDVVTRAVRAAGEIATGREPDEVS